MAPVTREHYESTRALHLQRLESIEQGLTPIPLASTPTVVLHIVPATALDPLFCVPLDLVESLGMLPMTSSSRPRTRYCLDGLVKYRAEPDATSSYVMMLRAGVIESVANAQLDRHGFYAPWQTELLVLRRLNDYVRLLRQLRATTPVSIWLTLTGMAGIHTPLLSTLQELEAQEAADCPLAYGDVRLTLPMIAVDYFDAKLDPGVLMRPAFDALWQAFGHTKSHSYDQAGNWHENAVEG